jgi:hypothetical protein
MVSVTVDGFFERRDQGRDAADQVSGSSALRKAAHRGQRRSQRSAAMAASASAATATSAADSASAADPASAVAAIADIDAEILSAALPASLADSAPVSVTLDCCRCACLTQTGPGRDQTGDDIGHRSGVSQLQHGHHGRGRRFCSGS